MSLQVMQMEMSQTKNYRKQIPYHLIKRNAGLTLIEVLIALAIVSIAMTAVIKAASQNIRGTSYLQNKSIATWVGEEVLNSVRVNVLKLPDGDKLKQSTTMLDQKWYWEAQKQTTPNKHITKISVDVFTQDPEENNTSPIVSLETYTYEE